MSKRKVQFAEEPKEDLGEPAQRRFKDKHSIDSDEENEEEVAEVARPNKIEAEQSFLTEDDIEGQEDDTIKAYDDIKVTPFNLREEMEEGHFDAEGNYIADKDPDAIQDEWLEGIDWSKIKENEKDVPDEIEIDEPEKITTSDKLKTLKNIVELLKPGENVLKALRRLGGKKSSSQRKGRANKGENAVQDEDLDLIKKNKENLLKLTEMADLLLQQGDFEIYDKTYEKLSHEIKSQEERFQDADDDDELEKAFMGGGKDEGAEENLEEGNDPDEVMWEYKWKNNEDAEVYGPYKNSCMISWNDQGFFKDGVFCRKTSSDGNFHSSKRIDFELYS